MKLTISIDVEMEELLALFDILEPETENEDKYHEENDSEEPCHGPCARVFDESCRGWTKDSEYNLHFLTHQQNYANELLRRQGYLFLNDVYEMIGLPKTKAGQVVGWTYCEGENPNGDNFVDFGLYDIEGRPRQVDFINRRTNIAVLDFNVDGNILDLI